MIWDKAYSNAQKDALFCKGFVFDFELEKLINVYTGKVIESSKNHVLYSWVRDEVTELRIYDILKPCIHHCAIFVPKKFLNINLPIMDELHPILDYPKEDEGIVYLINPDKKDRWVYPNDKCWNYGCRWVSLNDYYRLTKPYYDVYSVDERENELKAKLKNISWLFK